MRKLFIFTLLFLLLISISIVVSLRFFPSLYVAAFNEIGDEQLLIEKLDVNFFPLMVNIEQFDYENEKGQSIATAKNVKLSGELLAWVRDHNNFWKLEVDDAIVKLHHFAESSSAENESTDDNDEPLNVHQFVSGLNVDFNSITIQFDEQSSVDVSRLSTQVNDTTLVDVSKVEQDIEFLIKYHATQNSAPLVVEGVLQSRMVKGVSMLAVEFPKLNLDPMLGAIESSNESSVASVEREREREAEIDWRWLTMLEPLTLDLKVANLVWTESSANNLELSIGIDDEIDFSAQTELNWLGSEEVSFNDTLTLNGTWKAISARSMGADLRGNLHLSTTVLTADVEGDVNLNGDTGSKVSLKLVSKDMPVTTQLDSETVSVVNQYFPVDVSLKLEQLEALTKLDIISAKFGESDVKGSLEVSQNSTGLLSITSNLTSEKIVYKPVDDSTDDSTEEELSNTDVLETRPPLAVREGAGKSADTLEASSTRLFSDEVIDWAWLSDIIASINWQAEKVVFDELEVTAVNLPISLGDGVLEIKLDAQSIASGSLTFDSLLKKNDKNAELSVSLVASSILLEQLKLLPADQLQKGVTDIQLNLNSRGNSNQEFAAALNGTVKMKVGTGVLGNNSFELIGSDLILGILNKLNPFAKSDKTTELQCAVVNLNIVDGKVDIDKSLALKTSKLTIVADGYVNLATEKVKLNITPKARSGVGVDAASLVKFVALGGTLMEPTPVFTASGAIKSAAIVGAAVSTGGLSLLASNAAEKTVLNVDVCDRAEKRFSQASN